MASIRKRAGVWYSDIRLEGRRVRKRLSSDKVIAEEKLAGMVRGREAHRDGRPQPGIPWADFLDKYLAYCRGSKSPATAIRDKAGLKAMAATIAPRVLSDITPEALERWKAARRAEGKGNATINKDMMIVKTMMRRAVIWGYLTKWDGTSVKKLKEARGRLLFYTVEEMRRLLAVCDSRLSCFYDWTTICLLGARAGLRRSEIYWLSWRDVDLERGVLSVIAKDGWIPKSGETRHVPIPPDLARHLKRVKRRTEWVIGERPSLAVMSAFFQKISRKAKLAGNIHTLRHTYASHLVQAGVDLFTVCELLGHSDTNITRIYAHLAPHNYAAAVAKLPRL